MGSISATSHSGREEGSAVADASGLLHTLQGHVDDIRALLYCGICVRPLYEPYTLACGHTFCYGCLTSWFNSGRSHKTCPDCRAQVKIQPAPAYLVRTLVQMFTCHAELLEKDETTAEHSKNQREEAEKLEADKSNEDPNTGGLFQGFFKPKPHHAGPIFDAEDGIARCPNCAWELEEDSCMNCGYHVEDGTISSMSDSDDFSDMTDDDDEEDEDDDDDDEEEMGDADGGFADYDGAWVDEYPHPLPFSFQQIYGAAQHFAPHQHQHHNNNNNHNPFHPYNQFLANPIFRRPPFNNFASAQRPDGSLSPPPMSSPPPSSHAVHSSGNESEEEEDEDEDEDMDSFIDDGDPEVDGSESGSHTDRSTVVGDHDDYMGYDGYQSEAYGYDTGTDAHSTPGGRDSASGEDQDEDQEEDDDDDDDDDDDEPIRLAPIRRTGQAPSFFQNNRPTNRGRNNLPPFGFQSSPVAGTSANNAINVDDDSEDEMPVSAIRRARRNNRR